MCGPGGRTGRRAVKGAQMSAGRVWMAAAGLAVLCQAASGARVEQTNRTSVGQAGVTRASFGKTADGEPVEIFTLTNGSGVEARVISYGAIITSLKVPDRAGAVADVVLGFDTLDGYLKEHPYFGAVVGRFGNRIARAQFSLEGRTYKLAANNGPNHLHGGVRGFDKYVWQAEPLSGRLGVSFSRTSPDGEEGYPGALKARVSYVLTDKSGLSIEYEVSSDQPTPVNLTQHTYFNLAGHASGSVVGHELMLNADRFTPVDDTLIPTGELAPVNGTPLDFRSATPIGARIDADHPQLKFGIGYDHNFVVNRAGSELALAARVVEPKSGRTLEVSTTEPGVQFYSGNFLDGTVRGKGGAVYNRRNGLCLETQHFPDSPNQPAFPSSIVRPGQTYKSQTVWRFGVK